MFQSLVRAYKRSDDRSPCAKRCQVVVSIPRSGLQAFRRFPSRSLKVIMFMFQSLVRAYKRSDYQRSRSLPSPLSFQSLVRAYKRSDIHKRIRKRSSILVSIPRSGLQAFRLENRTVSSLGGKRFNPSFGLTSVPTMTLRNQASLGGQFQSLVRAYKRSDCSQTLL